MSKRTSSRWSKLAIVALCLALHSIVFQSDSGQGLELWFLDRWFGVRGPISAPDDIVLVAMDEQSYEPLGVSMNEAWPRALHARLVRRLAELGAKRVVFDILFVGAGSNPSADLELSTAMSSLPVVLGAELERSSQNGFELQELVVPDPRIAASVETLALVNLPEEFERVRTFMQTPQQLDPQLPTFAEAACFGRGPFSSEKLPSDRDLINFYGPAGTGLRVISYYQLLEQAVPFPADLVRGKTVFVGLMLRTALGPAQKDSFLSPYGRMFGVEIHATAAANTLTQDWIRRSSAFGEWLTLSCLLALIVYLILSLSPLWGGLLVLATGAAWATSAVVALSMDRFVPGAIAFGIMSPLAFTCSTLGNYLGTRRKQREIERAFGHYLSPTMVEELKKNPDALRLGGEQLEATALFTDLVDFTNLSEKLSATELIRLLNAYFSTIAAVVFEENGTLIKFIGDSMFVVWGAPVPMSDHAARATRAALKIQRVLKAFNDRGEYPPLVTRIGVNTGPMVVGNLGSESRFDYTAIGDAVNLASRVEGLNKYLGTPILISEDTYDAAFPEEAVRMGTVLVKGKEVPVILYALFPEPPSDREKQAWKEALRCLLARRWTEATQRFRRISESSEQLRTASLFYCEQIEMLAAGGAGADWRGEIVFHSK